MGLTCGCWSGQRNPPWSHHSHMKHSFLLILLAEPLSGNNIFFLSAWTYQKSDRKTVGHNYPVCSEAQRFLLFKSPRAVRVLRGNAFSHIFCHAVLVTVNTALCAFDALFCSVFNKNVRVVLSKTEKHVGESKPSSYRYKHYTTQLFSSFFSLQSRNLNRLRVHVLLRKCCFSKHLRNEAGLTSFSARWQESQ